MLGSFAFQSSKVKVVIAIVIVIAKKEDNSGRLPHELAEDEAVKKLLL